MRDRRSAIAARYNEAFADLPVRRPATARRSDTHAWHLYVMRLTPDAPINRDTFIDEMGLRHAIGCSVHFIPLHRHPYWRDRYRLVEAAFPAAEAAFAGAVSLPLSSALTDEQVDRVIAATRALLTP